MAHVARRARAAARGADPRDRRRVRRPRLTHVARRRAFAALTFATLALATLVTAGCDRAPNESALTRADAVDGQWVWTAADAARYAESRRPLPALVPGVWVATIAVQHDTVTQRLALGPSAVGGAPLVAVVRFDDAFHAAWDRYDDDALAAAVGARLTRLLAALHASGARVTEVQLDYDCPERRLARWARLVRALGRGALAGRPLWVTSIPAHLRHDDYGALFRGAVAGHVIQVFDTGIRFDAASLGTLSRQLEAQRLPFRLGVGAFERTLGTGAVTVRTEHRAWFAAERVVARSGLYRGLWVFPGGRPWTAYRLPVTAARPPAP